MRVSVRSRKPHRSGSEREAGGARSSMESVGGEGRRLTGGCAGCVPLWRSGRRSMPAFCGWIAVPLEGASLEMVGRWPGGEWCDLGRAMMLLCVRLACSAG
jgi:hypothetical protein